MTPSRRGTEPSAAPTPTHKRIRPLKLAPEPTDAASPEPTPERSAETIHTLAFERLRHWRMQQADGLPAYVIASNAKLDAILEARPSTIEELLAIHGVGTTFCKRYGESLLAELEQVWGRPPERSVHPDSPTELPLPPVSPKPTPYTLPPDSPISTEQTPPPESDTHTPPRESRIRRLRRKIGFR